MTSRCHTGGAVPSACIEQREFEFYSSPSWLLGDHLGSTSMVADASGTVVSELRYSAFGETRYQNGSLTTDYLYTGQRQEAEIGLYYYVARWYDPAIGRFIQADTIVPNPASAKGYDRFVYADNNPLKYIDPSGHRIDLPCLFCDQPLFDYSNTTGVVNKIVDVLSTAACLVANCNVDRQADVVSGPTQEQHAAAMQAGVMIGNPIGMVSTPGVSSGGSKITTLLRDKIDNVLDFAIEKGIIDPDRALGISKGFVSGSDDIALQTLGEYSDDLYRHWGGSSPEIGPWVSYLEYFPDEKVAQTKLALPKTNPGGNITKLLYPSTKPVIIGEVASQVGNPYFWDHALGGGVQVYIPDTSLLVVLERIK